MIWRVGMKAVCIDAAIPEFFKNLHSAPLVEGAVYVVREVRISLWDGVLTLLVEGNIGKIHPVSHREQGFTADRFRPLVDTHTDISIFTKILHDVNHRQHEPAD